MPRRYVLFMADAPLSAADVKSLKGALEDRYAGLKVILVEGSPRAVIVRTDEPTSRALRDDVFSAPGAARITPVLTSGVIGKLKRRVEEAAANGKVHER